jgi:hypothetical protein
MKIDRIKADDPNLVVNIISNILAIMEYNSSKEQAVAVIKALHKAGLQITVRETK